MIENADAMRYILDRATPADSAIARGDRLLVSNPAEATRAVDSLATARRRHDQGAGLRRRFHVLGTGE